MASNVKFFLKFQKKLDFCFFTNIYLHRSNDEHEKNNINNLIGCVLPQKSK